MPGLYVERGYQAKAETVVLQWVLAGLAAILMLGGTLTAMFLSLADARPDLGSSPGSPSPGRSPRTAPMLVMSGPTSTFRGC